MHRCYSAILAAAVLAGPALAADEPEHLLVYSARPSDAARRNALPLGAPTTNFHLSCLAGRNSMADCSVISMDPPSDRADIAEAGVKFTKSIKFAARDRDGKPVEGRRFEVEWALLAKGDRNPDWLRRPTAEGLAAVWPVKAAQEGKDGDATIRCDVTIQGFLDRCVVLSETPEGYGFGAAALLLKAQFAMSPRMRDGKAVEGGVVSIPISWRGLEGDGMPVGKIRVSTDPNWAGVPSAASVASAYPAKAGDVASGQATLRCSLTDKGQPKGCDVTAESPSGKGFGAAAKSLTPGFTLQFSPDEAKLLKTLKIDIPFRFRNPTAPDDGVVTDVRWTQTLSSTGAEQLFPAEARKDGLTTGVGVVNCAATAQGDLADCRVAREDPAGKGFGAAAMEAAKRMKMNPWTKNGDVVEGRRLNVAIRFKLEGPPPAAPPAP